MVIEKKGKRMKQKRQPDTSVAWYKLADLITRKEREKALNVYRLLSHSFQDRAYALQLEGDILWSLDDTNASEKYKQAAFLYKKEKRWVNAAAVGEHLLLLQPENFELLSILVDLYAQLDWQEKCSERLADIYTQLEKEAVGTTQVFDVIKDLSSSHKAWISQMLKEHLSFMPSTLKPRVKRLL